MGALLHTYRTMQVNQCLGIIAFASLYYLWAAANLCENLKSDGYGPNNNGNGDDSCTKELGYAVFAGAASSFVCICLVIASFALGKDLSGLHNPLSIGMVLLWGVTLFVNTFELPFVSACMTKV